ncbi:uncharacterized protein LOC119090423 [Pollicipes pollicipes]|uniref:uncharacterized protein LOC119090423 n=1 Tax=Pollicipes pollicipes TaxID=41117 RepID=UPI00188492F5|nr:uncharacterized protein LOC119090423 [Pollicipes pollicipes]
MSAEAALVLTAMLAATLAPARALYGHGVHMISMPVGSKSCRCALRTGPGMGDDSNLVLELGELALVAGGVSHNSYVSCEEAKLFCPQQCAELAREVLVQDGVGSLLPPEGMAAASLCGLMQPNNITEAMPGTIEQFSFWVSYQMTGCRGSNTQYVGEVCCIVQAHSGDGEATPLVFYNPLPDCIACNLPPCSA